VAENSFLEVVFTLMRREDFFHKREFFLWRDVAENTSLFVTLNC
jgi:hypothetical protein